MGVPIVSEANKGKELLLEIDSIVPDTKGHHLADVSLSSNDSLSHSRRRWKLIRIISRMNPNLQGKSKKLIFYQSLSVLLALILTGITIYWLVNLNSKANSFELPSSSLLVSSRSSPSSSSSPIQAQPSPSSPLSESPSKMAEDLPESFDYSVIQPLSINDNPVLRLMSTSNDTKDGATLKIADSTDADETGDSEDYVKVTFWPPFSDEPEDWFADRFGPPYLPSPFYPTAPQLSPPPHPSTFRKSPMGLDESPQPFSDIINEQPMNAFNLAKFRSSAKSFHESAIGALDDIMRKLKDNKLIDFLVNGDENLAPDMGVPYDDTPEPYDDTLEETGSTVGFVNFRQLDDDQGPVDNIFKFLKKTIF